ncbi:hypothetical protein Vretimale_2222, partial [Volvox reticuliferus]
LSLDSSMAAVILVKSAQGHLRSTQTNRLRNGIASVSKRGHVCCGAGVTGLNFEDEKLLRTCLARNILMRLAERPSGNLDVRFLTQMCISPLQAPPAPPSFWNLTTDLTRLRPVAVLEPIGSGTSCKWGREASSDIGSANVGMDTNAGMVDTAAALRRYLGPPLPYHGYTTISGKKCFLAPGDTVQRFLEPSLESFLLSLFRCIEDQRKPMVTLGPYCLFHAHLFIASPPVPGVGLLFHACEYPAFDEDCFPYRLGYCQENSPLRPMGQQLAQRNFLWYQNQLLMLDLSPGSLLRNLLWKETAAFYTINEDDFGLPILDVTLNVGNW